MKQPSSASSFNSRARRLAPGFALGVAALITASPAQAAFHLWTIRELYSDASGSLQFIELFCPANGQTVLGGQSITVRVRMASTKAWATEPRQALAQKEQTLLATETPD